jgi:signal transduction histidine kinase/CheY-like chemotaxis protein
MAEMSPPRSTFLDDSGTQTIELTDLFTTDLTPTGSFDVSGEIWKTTFGKVIQALPIPVLLIDGTSRIVVANQAWRKITPNYDKLRSHSFSSLFPDGSVAKRAQGLLDEVFSTRRPRVAQADLLIDDRRFWARMTLRSIRIIQDRFVLLLIEDLTLEKQLLDENKRHRKELEKRVKERTAELRDANAQLQKEIAERKRAEELVLHTERLKAVGELASGTAHNFNNLLQIVMSGARLALMNLESGNLEKAKKAIGQILESAAFGSETVRRLQSFANVRNEDSLVEDALFDLCDVVRPAVELTKPWWKTHPEKHGIKVDLRLDFNSKCPIVAKKHEIFEVVVNLIKNAAEALPHGGIIYVSCDVQANVVMLRVRDTGIGIPAHMTDKLFMPFFTTKVTAGAGLGLAASQSIVKRYGGSIFVESVEREGSTFTVCLPKSMDLPEATGSPPGLKEHQPLNILVIDDVEAVLDLLADALRECKHTVHTAQSGEEGIEIFKGRPVEVVICDLGMPGITGWEVSKQVAEICENRGIPKTPFVLLTGWGDQVREIERMSATGVNRILTKPVDLPQLLETIRGLVRTV